MAVADTSPIDTSGGALQLPDVSGTSEQGRSAGSMAVPIIVGILVPVLLALAIRKKNEKKKPSSIQIDVGGDPGLTIRNHRYLSLLETPWEGADNIAAVFEQACSKHSAQPLLGTRVFVSTETIVSSGGKPFEKVTLGEYVWISFAQTFQRVVNFSSGLVAIGLQKGERVAIFAETRADWFVALQACFRQNVAVITIYASLGEDALVHSLNEVYMEGEGVNPLLLRSYVFLFEFCAEFSEIYGALLTFIGIEHPFNAEHFEVNDFKRLPTKVICSVVQDVFEFSTSLQFSVTSLSGMKKLFLGGPAFSNINFLDKTEAGTVICDRKQLKKLLELSKQLETVKRVVYMDDVTIKSEPTLSEAPGEWTVQAFASIESLGQASPVEAQIPESSDVAVIMYTSGSTGLPKGVMMTHGNLVAAVAGLTTSIPQLASNDAYLAYLPLAHVLELLAEVTLSAGGARIGYGSPLTLTDTSNKVKKGTKGDATQLQPTLMSAVPAILDRVRDGVRKTVEGKGGITKKLFELAYNRRLAAIDGSWLGAYGPEKLLWDTIVFKKIRAVLGGRIRGVISGGAPLSADTQRFMNICFGAPVGQGYGLTETCACGTFAEWTDTSVGRVGPPVPSTYIKLVDWEEGGYRNSDSPMPRGEIVLGGPCITLGYFKNEAKTAEAYKMDERGLRWFFTGDIARLHPDGCVEIIDRKKDIVKLQHGEYVSLGKVEAVLAGSKYVDGVMVHADPFHSFTVALVVPKQAALESWAQSAGISFEGYTDLVQKKEANSEVLTDLTKVGKQSRLEKWELPAKIKLLSEQWTPESGLVTAALKIKREVIRKTLGEDLKKLYS